MDGGPLYRVRIVYTEPAFQVRLAEAPDFYTIDYMVRDAAGPEEAVKAAMREWDHCVANTRVGWGRCIESILVDRPSGPQPDAWVIGCSGPAARAADRGWRVPRHRRHLEGQRD